MSKRVDNVERMEMTLKFLKMTAIQDGGLSEGANQLWSFVEGCQRTLNYMEEAKSRQDLLHI